MKGVKRTALLLVCATALAQSAAEAQDETKSIAWAKDLAHAKAQSARDGRPVLLYFTFDT